MHHRQINGCRCPDGLDDMRRHRYRVSHGLRYDDPTPIVCVDPTGSTRRLQAAAVAGWALPPIAAACGHTTTTLSKIRRGIARYVYAATADDIRRAVDELLTREAPDNRARRWALRDAAAGGWVALDEWLPDEVDDPAALPDSAYRRPTGLVAVSDEPCGPTPLELREMVDLGWSLGAIIERTKLPEDIVTRRLEHAADVERRGRRSVPAETIYAIRDEYLRTRHTGWSGKAAAERYGVSTWLVSTVIRGTTRPELGLTDLTVQQGGHTSAAPPTGGSNRKGSAA